MPCKSYGNVVGVCSSSSNYFQPGALQLHLYVCVRVWVWVRVHTCVCARPGGPRGGGVLL